ncbi:MAG: insulinase family protein [Ruminococcus sp.]|nr:insulinase family protein [Ruminococcus sp.]
MKELISEKLFDNIRFHTVREERFKTFRLSAAFYVPLSADTVSKYALLTRILLRTCEKYPDFTALSKKLSALYGATLSADVFKAGDRLGLLFSVSGLDDRYALNSESVSKELSQLLCEIIFRPKLKDGVFDLSELALAKRELVDMIDSEFNDKRIYALQRATAVMCAGEPFAAPRLGAKDDVDTISAEELYTAWQKLISSARVEIFYVGESAPDQAKETFRNIFSEVKRENPALSNTVVRKVGEVKIVFEEMELSQSKMILGFRTDCAEPDDDVTAFRLMTAVLGGTAHSKLFNNVREKLSLCYYCAARYNRTKGILTVDSGVETDNIDKAKDAILKEIEDMKNGIITDFEIESAKMSVINSFNEMNDSAIAIEGWYLSQVFDQSMLTAEALSEKINAVTKDEIISAAKKLSLDTVYALKGVAKEDEV